MAEHEPIILNIFHIQYILSQFKREGAQAHQQVWKKRQYAPMNIFSDNLKDVRTDIENKYKDYTILFDVVFESTGIKTDWHCDYESLGPFIIENNYEAIKHSYFKSIHFNITDEGGSLVTLPWLWLSYLYNIIIVYFGIFSIPHYCLNAILRQLFYLFATKYSNQKGVGNFFDNMRLHSVTSGEPRISYVVRLAKKESIKISRESIQEGIKRSDACLAFIPLLDIVNAPTYASNIPWNNLSCKT